MRTALFSAQGNFIVPVTHPAFAGHFPGQPVLPGVVLLDLILAAADLAGHGLRLQGIAQVKFLRPVGPGEAVSFSLTERAGRGFEISAEDAGGPVLRGRLRLAEQAPP